MKLLEATDLLRELVASFPELDGKNFLVMIPETPPNIARDYEVVIRTKSQLEKDTEQAILNIAIGKRLAVLKAKNTIALYTPVNDVLHFITDRH